MIKFALIGAGRIGAMHAANIAAHPGASLAYVYDVDADAAEAVAAAHGSIVALSVEHALEDETVDAALIASSTDTHVDLILAALKVGKAVLCEKPIDLDIRRVERCRAAIAASGVAVQVGFNRRFDPSHRALRDAVRKGEIGALELLVVTSRDPSPPPRAYLKSSGGLFRDMTIHDFDLARFVLGRDPIEEVFAAGSVKVDRALRRLGDIDTAMVVMKTRSGALVHINNSRRAVYGYDQRIEAFGAKGMVQSDNLRATTLVRADAQGTDGKDPLLPSFVERYAAAYRAELDAFIDAVANGGKPPVGFEDGRAALILANAAWTSLKSGKSVKVRYA